MTSDTKAIILQDRLIPVVRAPSPEAALGAARALLAGGIRLVEITMTVPGALQVIETLNRELGSQLVVGAGTVLDAATALATIRAGARFVVSPGFDPATVRACQQQQILTMPGALTPTEVLNAWQAGADFVKVFPAGNLGGPDYIKTLRGPFPQIPFVPTGGVDLDTIEAFFKAGAAAVGVGGNLVEKEAMARGDFARITRLAEAFVSRIPAAGARG